MNELKKTGGARIGAVNATWPFATLTVTPEKLTINATILGNYVFKPSDIISIEPYSRFLSQGIKINHKVASYKELIVFWSFGDSNELIKRIEQTGFLSNRMTFARELDEQISKAQNQGGFPIKRSAAIAIVVIWNVFFLMDFLNFFGGQKVGSPLGFGAQLALGTIIFVCLLLLTFEPARRIILKEGRTIEDIKLFVFFIMFLCGSMFVVITLTH